MTEKNLACHKERMKSYALMVLLVCLWGYEYVAAKYALAILAPLTLVFLKYLVGLFCLLGLKLMIDGKKFIKKKDIPVLIGCALFGELLYFWSEYTAMSYMPVSLITIVLSFVPALSVIIERIVYKTRVNLKIYLGILGTIVGIVFVVGSDFSILFQGRIIGYLLAFFAVFSWNMYNFLTRHLTDGYTVLTLTVNQTICAMLLCAPFALGNIPPLAEFTPQVVAGVLYLGIVSAAIGFFIYVKALGVLGPTSTALFSNFLPITATLSGWIFLGETIGAFQIFGGVIVIGAGCYVLREKGKLEELEYTSSC